MVVNGGHVAVKQGSVRVYAWGNKQWIVLGSCEGWRRQHTYVQTMTNMIRRVVSGGGHKTAEEEKQVSKVVQQFEKKV